MNQLSALRATVLLTSLVFWPQTASAQCGADGEIPDRATLDAILGGNQTLENFESFSVPVGGAVNLDVSILDDSTIANGQGPGLVAAGATYIDPSGVQLQWNGDQYFNRTTQTILSNGVTGEIYIRYSPTVQAMGLDISAFDGFPSTGTMRVYDASNTLVGTTNFSVAGGASRDFTGWQHLAGIERVEIFSPDFPWSPKIDDHGYGDCDGDRFVLYCDPSDGHPNNVATISLSGNVLSQGPITVDMGNGPANQFGYLLVGSSNGIVSQPPGAKGDLCVVGGFLGRYDKDIANTGSTGTLSTNIEDSLSSGPNYELPNNGGNIVPGQTWYFQYWHRQPMGQPATFSQAVCVTFKP